MNREQENLKGNNTIAHSLKVNYSGRIKKVDFYGILKDKMTCYSDITVVKNEIKQVYLC